MHLKEIKELAKKFTADELNLCIDQQLKEGKNICDVSGPMVEVLNALSKAEYVKNLMNKGVSLTDAVRELAKKIREVQQGFKSE
jgi:Mn-dependent DtxR family transcriptional regulator